ncbi:MAG: hypothetical protein RLZZ50_1153, partial [Verrucomicrobiota bacterium]
RLTIPPSAAPPSGFRPSSLSLLSLFFSCGHWPHYHQPSDTPEKLNYDKLAALMQWIAGLLPRLDEVDLSHRPAATGDYSAPFEAASIARALSPETLARLDIAAPRTRADVTAFVGRLLRETTELG